MNEQSEIAAECQSYRLADEQPDVRREFRGHVPNSLRELAVHVPKIPLLKHLLQFIQLR
jgi:hypothetical protein